MDDCSMLTNVHIDEVLLILVDWTPRTVLVVLGWLHRLRTIDGRCLRALVLPACQEIENNGYFRACSPLMRTEIRETKK